jgi:SAM-dependent methyltransferase
MTTNPQEWERHWKALDATVDLEPARAWRHRTVIALSASILDLRSTAVILDVGCGRGEILEAVKRRYPDARCVGVDGVSGPSWSQRVGIEFLLADLETLDLADEPLADLCGKVDLIICSELIEHMDDDRQLVQHLHTLLVAGGMLILTAPGGPMGHIDRYFGHRRHYTRSQLYSHLSNAGFSNIAAASRGFPFFSIYRVGLVLGGVPLTRRVAMSTRTSPLRVTQFVFFLFRILFRLPSPRIGGWQHVLTGLKT